MTPTNSAGSDTTNDELYPDDILVSPDWVAAHLDQFTSNDPSYRLLEVDVHTSFYAKRHIPGAIGLDWRNDLRSESSRDIVGPTELERVLGECGVTEDTTIVVYGDNANWFATHFYWMMSYYGHRDVRVMDGGRNYWEEHGYPMETSVPDPEPTNYVVQAQHSELRATREDVEDAIGDSTQLIDVRTQEEYTGKITAPPGTNESALRGGHIPGAVNVFWAENIKPDRRFKSPSQLAAVYRDKGLLPEKQTVTYCRIGERSAVTWFVLHELLGYEQVANYDGSWVEWGNMINAPIETGE